MTDMGEVEAAPGIVLQFLSDREGWTATSVISRDTALEVRMSIAGDERQFALVIPRPALGEDQPWLYMDPQDLEEWAAMLGTWIDEEVLTGAARWAKLTAEGELHYFHPAPWGFRKD
jgi:hypothetical protein